MLRQYRKFDEDFKSGAVRLVFETGKPIAQVTRDLGVNEGTLGNWVAAARRQRDGGSGPLSEDERAGLVRLRRQNAELRMQRDVLKRRVALWVDEAMGPVMVAAFIAAQREVHGIPHATACRAPGVTPAWFYKWRDSDPSPQHARRAQLDTAAALMREQGLQGRPKRHRRSTTRPGRATGGRRTGSAGSSPPRRSITSGTATPPRSSPRRASCSWTACWMWPPGGSSASPWVSITTRHWPTR